MAAIIGFPVAEIVEKVGEQITGSKVGLKSWNSKDINPGVGFQSDIFRVNLEWKETDKANLPNSLVFKIPGLSHGQKHFDRIDFGDDVDEANRPPVMEQKEIITNGEKRMRQLYLQDMAENADSFATFHNHECSFYHQFNNVPSLLIPKVYHSLEWNPAKGEQGLIVMEDLSDSSTMVHLCDGLNMKQVKVVVDNLASLHAHVHNLDPNSWIPKYMPDMEKMTEFFAQMPLVASQIVKAKPDVFAPLWERIKPMFDSESFQSRNGDHDRRGIPTTLLHGDMWATNLMWQKDANSGKPKDELNAIIDWQLVRPGSPLIDLMHLLLSSTTADFRRKNTNEILSYYHQRMKEKLGDQLEYSLASLEANWLHLLPMETAMLVFAMVLWVGIPAIVGEEGSETREARVFELLTRVRCAMEDSVAILDAEATD